jgi:hypothetical protein
MSERILGIAHGSVRHILREDYDLTPIEHGNRTRLPLRDLLRYAADGAQETVVLS